MPDSSLSSFTMSCGSRVNLRSVEDDLTTTHWGTPSLIVVHVRATVANGPSWITS